MLPWVAVLLLSTSLGVQLTHNAVVAFDVDLTADFETRFQQLRDHVADETFKVHTLYLKAGINIFRAVLDSAALVKNKPKGARRFVKKLKAYLPELEEFVASGSRDVKDHLYKGREFFLRIYHHYDELEFDKMNCQQLWLSLIQLFQSYVDNLSVELTKFVDVMSEEEKRKNKKFLEWYKEYKREIYLLKHLELIDTYLMPLYINTHPGVKPVKYT